LQRIGLCTGRDTTMVLNALPLIRCGEVSMLTGTEAMSSCSAGPS